MVSFRSAHAQVTAAVWGTVCGVRTFDSEGHLVCDCNPYAAAFSEALELYRGVSGTGAFFERWEYHGSS